MTITRLVSILFCVHAGSSRIVLNFWHSSDPEPNVHFLAHAPRGARTPRVYECEESYSSARVCGFWPKPFKSSASIKRIPVRVTRCDRVRGERTTSKKQWVSLRGEYVWGVCSTVTKCSDYRNFVSKDTSERVAWRCDDPSWQKASESLFTKTLIFGGSSATNKFVPKPPETLSPTRH